MQPGKLYRPAAEMPTENIPTRTAAVQQKFAAYLEKATANLTLTMQPM